MFSISSRNESLAIRNKVGIIDVALQVLLPRSLTQSFNLLYEFLFRCIIENKQDEKKRKENRFMAFFLLAVIPEQQYIYVVPAFQ